MNDYFKLLSKIYNDGQSITARGVTFRELIDQKIVIDPSYNYYSCPSRHIENTSKYLFGELAWYLSGNRYINGINKYSKFWNQIANKDETANSNYGYLVFYRKKYEFTNYEWCLNSLISDKHSRQAVMLYNSKEFYYEGNKDFLCTQTQQFFIRNNELISIVNIRSSDAIKGLTFDIPWWSLVQQKLLLDLKTVRHNNLVLGDLIINIGSAHIYNKDLELVNKMLLEDRKFYKIMLFNNFKLVEDQKYYEDNLNCIVGII